MSIICELSVPERFLIFEHPASKMLPLNLTVMIKIVTAVACVCFFSGLLWSPHVAAVLANFFYNEPIVWIICLVGVFLTVAGLFFWVLETALFGSVKQSCR